MREEGFDTCSDTPDEMEGLEIKDGDVVVPPAPTSEDKETPVDGSSPDDQSPSEEVSKIAAPVYPTDEYYDDPKAELVLISADKYRFSVDPWVFWKKRFVCDKLPSDPSDEATAEQIQRARRRAKS